MDKKLSVLFLLPLIALTACGGNKGTSQDGVVTVRFAGRSNESEESNYKVFIEDFMKDNPNIKVTIDWYANESAYNNALKGQLKNLPDMFMLSDDQFIPYVRGGFLANYKDLVDMEDLENTVYKYGAEAYCYNTRTNEYGWSKDDADCGFYGYPKDQGPYALMYNKTMFKSLMDAYNALVPADQLSMPDATTPYTYSQFIELCLKLKGVSKEANFYPCAGYDLDSAIYSNNADYFNSTATTQRITEQNFIDAVTFMRDLYSQGIIAPYGGAIGTGEQAFLNSKCLFYYAGPWKCKDYWSQIKDFEWDLCPVCVGSAEGAKSTAYIGSMGYVISEKSKVKEAAAQLAKYLATHVESQRSQYKRGQAIPNLISLKDEFIKDERKLLTGKCPEHRSVWIDVIDGSGETKTRDDGTTYTDIVTGKYRPGRFTYSSTWRTNFSNWLAGQGSNGKSVWKNEISPKQSLEDYASTLQDELDAMQEELLQ